MFVPFTLVPSLLCPVCSHCKATVSSIPSPLVHAHLLLPSLSPGAITPQQCSRLPFPVSLSSPCLSFIHPSTQLYSLPLLVTSYLSAAEIPVTFAHFLFFFSLLSQFLRRWELGVTIAVVQAKSSTTCSFWVKNCSSWKERHRGKELQTKERKREDLGHRGV